MVERLKRLFRPVAALPKGAGEPIELKRGGVYVIESEEPLNAETIADIRVYLKTFQEETGCQFLILDAGLHVSVSERRDG